MSSTKSSTSSIVKVESLSMEAVNSMSHDDVAAYIKGARRAVRSADTGRENATDRAAYATWLAEHREGIIGADNKPGKDDVDPGWMTDEKWADTFDRVKSNTGYWRTLGRVLMTLGVDKDSSTYMRLRKSNSYQKPECKKVIWAESTTADNAVEVIDAWLDGKVDEFGKAIPKPRAANPEGQTPRDKTPASVTEAIEAVNGDDAAKAKVLVAALAVLIGRLDVDAWQEVDSAIEALRKDTNDRFASALSIAKASA